MTNLAGNKVELPQVLSMIGDTIDYFAVVWLLVSDFYEMSDPDLKLTVPLFVLTMTDITLIMTQNEMHAYVTKPKILSRDSYRNRESTF